LTWALVAAGIGILAIFLFIFIMYGWRQALITLSVLVSFMVVLGLFMKLVDYALSLSWIAAVVLSIGMAVDANILIYERMREEVSNWKSKSSAIDVAYDRSRPAIRDGNISTGLIALLLFMLWSNMFKGFGTMLIVTVCLTLFVNVPLTKILLKTIYKTK
jgi:protein-export membrane protein SecD